MSSLATSTRDPAVEISLQLLDSLTADYPHHDFAIRLWNGDTWGNTSNPRFTLVLKHAGTLRHLLLGASQLTLGESYIYDDFDIEGNVEAAFSFGDYLVAHEVELMEKLHMAGLLFRLPHNGHHHDEPRLHLHGRAHS